MQRPAIQVFRVGTRVTSESGAKIGPYMDVPPGVKRIKGNEDDKASCMTTHRFKFYDDNSTMVKEQTMHILSESLSYYIGRQNFKPSHSFPNVAKKPPKFNPLHATQCRLNLVTIVSSKGQSEYREGCERCRKLSFTTTSMHIEGVTQRAMMKNSFAAERHEAFHHRKVASLRHSPAYIVWPTRYPEIDSTDIRSQTTSEESTSQGDQVGRRDTDTNSPSSDAEAENNLAIREAFWENAVGSIRIDSMYLGSPRFDPYLSTWTPDERRCFFTSGAVTHHSRPFYLHRLLDDNAAKYKEKKEGQSIKSLRHRKFSRSGMIRRR